MDIGSLYRSDVSGNMTMLKVAAQVLNDPTNLHDLFKTRLCLLC